MVSMSKAKSEPRAKPQRFYNRVEVAACEGGFCITLDGKSIKTPARKMLQVTREHIAQQIAAEWDAQAEVIDADTMPLTRLASITLDRIPEDRDALIADMVGYCETDLLCYRAPRDAVGEILTDNDALRARQDAAFDPLLAWATEQGVALSVTDGIVPLSQPKHSITRFAAEISAANDAELAALAMLVPLLGSAVLTLALWKEKITVEEALLLARIDEDFYAARWGIDAEQVAQWEAKARDIRACAFFLTDK